MILTHVDLIEKLLKYVPAADTNKVLCRQKEEEERRLR